MVEIAHLPFSLPPSPPDSLDPLPITWNDDQVTEIESAMAAMKIDPILPSYCCRGLLRNPPSTPYPCPDCSTKSSAQIAREFVEQCVEALKSVSAKNEPLPPPTPSSAGSEDESTTPKARASTLDFKRVNEVYVYVLVLLDLRAGLMAYSWDKKEYKYKVVESLTPPNKVNELDHYIFIVCICIGRCRSPDPDL
jgi:hypothetical protein